MLPSHTQDRSWRRLASDRRRRHRFQLVQIVNHALRKNRDICGSDPCRIAGIELENVVTQLGRGTLELPLAEFCKQAGVGVISQRVLKNSGLFTVIEVAVRQDKHACAHLLKVCAILIDGSIDALDIQVFRLWRRAIEAHALKRADLGNVSQKCRYYSRAEARLRISLSPLPLVVGAR